MLEIKFIYFSFYRLENYAEQIQDVLRGFEDKFYIETIKQIPGRELSKFQKKGIKEGREIYNFKLSLI